VVGTRGQSKGMGGRMDQTKSQAGQLRTTVAQLGLSNGNC
jgi:hypothetical protein